MELALCLPLIVFFAAVLVEVGCFATDHVRVWHAARESARVAVVDPDHVAIVAAAERTGLDGLRIEVEPTAEERIQGEPLKVVVSYEPRSFIPLVGRLFEGFTLQADATMRIEQP